MRKKVVFSNVADIAQQHGGHCVVHAPALERGLKQGNRSLNAGILLG